MSTFAQPAPSSDVKIADYVGHLLLFYPRAIRQGIVTTNGLADALIADVVILTHPDGPSAESNVLVFQKVLLSTLKGSIGGDPVLARLARGTAKPGQSAPYILTPFDQADGAFATTYMNSVGGNPFPSFQPPTAPAPVPQAAPVAPLPVAMPQAVPVPVPTSAPVPQAVPVPAAPIAAYPAPAPAPQAAAPAPAAPPVTLPTGQTVTAEQAAAMAALGMTTLPPAAPIPAAPTA